MLRGSRDFGSIDEYRAFLKKLFTQLNAGREKRLKEEIDLLKPLPSSRMDTTAVETARVSSGSTVNVKGNIYSVNSRLKGETVKARIHLNHIEIWYAQRKVASLQRLRGKGKHRINYRHIIEGLIRKPGAFRNFRYREDLYPNSLFRTAYDRLRETSPGKADKEYLRLLYAAFKEGEARVGAAIRLLLSGGETVTPEAVNTLVKDMEEDPPVPSVEISGSDPGEYDVLLHGYIAKEATNEIE